MNPFIIAELSANHNNDKKIALKSIKEVAKIKADSIKLQTYTPECITLPFKNEYFKINGGLWDGYYYYDLYKQGSMPFQWHEELFVLARKLQLIIFSSPFSTKGVDFLETLGCPIYKIASFEIAHTELLKRIAQTKKPVIMSLGIANDLEILNALNILKENEKITLMHCISEYPATLQDYNLFEILKLKCKFRNFKNVEIGLSDHCTSNIASIIATTIGASAIEKHFILNKNINTLDKDFSLNPSAFKKLIKDISDSKNAINNMNLDSYLDFHKIKALEKIDITLDVIRNVFEKTNRTQKKGRMYARSLFVSHNIKKGETFSAQNIACVRPNLGISPLYLDFILGKKCKNDISAGSPLKIENIEF